MAPRQSSLEAELAARFDPPESADFVEPASPAALVAPSPDEPDDELSPDELSPDDAPSPGELLDPSPEPAAAAALVFDVELVDRSFFAQPEPLKWTDGATTAFRSVPSAPQLGQNRGVGASIPWMNSVRVVQFEQT